MGHSEGTLIGAMIAARNPDVAFFIAMSATARNGYEILLEQTGDMLRAAGADEVTIQAEIAKVKQALDLILAEDWGTLESFLLQETNQQLEALPAEQRAAIGDLEAHAAQQVAQSMQQNRAWMHFFITYDIAADWAQIQAPILVLLGELDTQVDLDEAKASLQEAFAASGNPNTALQVIEQANHLFQRAGTGSPDEYISLPNEFAPGFLESMSNWLLTHVETVWEAQVTTLQALDATLQAEMARLDVPGTTIAVVKDGRVLYEKGFGIASVETEEPITPVMLFRIGSTTKMFTALGLAILMNDGAVDLQAPIGTYVNGLDPALAQLTGVQLLTHAAGLKDEGPSFGPHDPAALAATVQSWTDESHRFTGPDRVFSYSNPGYALAGLLLEAAAGGTYAEQIQELILDPLGMTRSTFSPTLAMTFPFAQGHELQPDGTLGVVRPYPDHAGYWPAGFMISNVGDMARFAMAMMDGGVVNDGQTLSFAAIEMISSPHIQVKDDMEYGYGLFLHTERGVAVVEHAGGILGFTSLYKMVPEHRFAVIILANRGGAIFTETAAQAMELLLPMEALPTQTDQLIMLDEEAMRDYVGAYAQMPEQVFEIAIIVERLVVSMGEIVMPLAPVGEDQFKLAIPDLSEQVSVGFIRDETGAIEFMTLGNRAYAKQ